MPNPNRGLLSGGRLAYGCTNLALDWPHGGTRIGLVGDVGVFMPSEWEALEQEETNSASKVVWLGGDVVVWLTLAEWDNAGIEFLVPNTAQVGGHTILEWPGSDVVAGVGTTTYTNVVFTPADPSQPGFVLFKAAPVPALNAKLALSSLLSTGTLFKSRRDSDLATQNWVELPGVLIGLPDGTDRVGKMGKFAGLVSGGL